MDRCTDLQRQIDRASDWLMQRMEPLSVEKADEFMARYEALIQRTLAECPDVTYRCLEFGPNDRLQISKYRIRGR